MTGQDEAGQEGSPIRTAAAILSIPPSRPERLFAGDATQVRQLYRRLARQWHPDRNRSPEATEVFQRIAALYAVAKEQITQGRWHPACGERLLTGHDSRQQRISYVDRRPFELGELLIGETVAAFLVRPDAADLHAAGVARLGALRFASERMRRQVSPCLPQVQAALEGPEHCALVVDKPQGMVLLADLIERSGGAVPLEQVGWIVSGLCNLACYLEWARLTHNAIGPDTVFVSRRRHAVALLGGWWYAARMGAPLVALPQRTVDTVPHDIVRSKIARPRCDLELIRATGRELLGDASGLTLMRDPSIPPAVADWLSFPTSGSALTDYRLWRAACARHRPRRCARMPVAADEVSASNAST